MSSAFIRTRSWTTPAMLAVYDDTTSVRYALAFERELAQAQAHFGLISSDAAQQIARACDGLKIDFDELANDAALAGTLAIPLVRRVREELGIDTDAARAVHRGATSQDLADTVMMLQTRDAAALVDDDLKRILVALTALARRHGDTHAVGRTLLQDARPITLGLRIAQWLAGIQEARRDLEAACKNGLRLQLGGAAGTRADLGHDSERIATRLADALGLVNAAPWHARRGHVAAIANAAGIAVGALAKMARDVGLLAQNNIGEVQEPLAEGRGGSSSMDHKRNPTSSQVALSASIRVPGLVATVLAGMPQELERGLGGWQAEAPTLAEILMLLAGSADAMALVAEELDIDERNIAHNLAQADIGNDLGGADAILIQLLAEYGSD